MRGPRPASSRCRRSAGGRAGPARARSGRGRPCCPHSRGGRSLWARAPPRPGSATMEISWREPPATTQRSGRGASSHQLSFLPRRPRNERSSASRLASTHHEPSRSLPCSFSLSRQRSAAETTVSSGANGGDGAIAIAGDGVATGLTIALTALVSNSSSIFIGAARGLPIHHPCRSRTHPHTHSTQHLSLAGGGDTKLPSRAL